MPEWLQTKMDMPTSDVEALLERVGAAIDWRHHDEEGTAIMADLRTVLATPPALDVERLRQALDDIRETCKPLSMSMSGPVWFDGGTPAGGGSRERIWRICESALSPTGDET